MNGHHRSIEHRVDVDGVSTYLLEQGPADGAAVLLLHGNPDSSRLWHDIAPRLAGYRLLMPDIPGFGHSRIDGHYGFGLEDHISWLGGILDAVLEPAQPVHLVVHDFGGPFGLSWAVRHPRRVLSVLASDTLYFSRYPWHFWARIWRTPLLGEIAMPLMGRRLFDWELRRGSKALGDGHLDRTWQLVTPAMKQTVLKLYRATDSAIFRGWEDELRELLAAVPSLALWGERDPYIAAKWAETLGARQVEIVPGAGHWLPAERPELFARRMKQLIESCRVAAE